MYVLLEYFNRALYINVSVLFNSYKNTIYCIILRVCMYVCNGGDVMCVRMQ